MVQCALIMIASKQCQCKIKHKEILLHNTCTLPTWQQDCKIQTIDNPSNWLAHHPPTPLTHRQGFDVDAHDVVDLQVKPLD